jgi:hypothetical protein
MTRPPVAPRARSRSIARPSKRIVDECGHVTYAPSMGQERAKTFADRLTPVVPRQEDDIAHLSDEMVDVLYPGRRPRPFRMGVIFRQFEGPNYPRAVALARLSPAYKEEQDGPRLRHLAAFSTEQARVLHELFEIVGPISDTEVTVDGKKLPYARELWLPRFWVFVSEES